MNAGLLMRHLSVSFEEIKNMTPEEFKMLSEVLRRLLDMEAKALKKRR